MHFGVKCCLMDQFMMLTRRCQETVYWLCASSSPCVLEVLCAFVGEVLSSVGQCQCLCGTCGNPGQVVKLRFDYFGCELK